MTDKYLVRLERSIAGKEWTLENQWNHVLEAQSEVDANDQARRYLRKVSEPSGPAGDSHVRFRMYSLDKLVPVDVPEKE